MSKINYVEINDYPMAAKEYSTVKTCPKCKKEFESIITEQVPGFREMDEDVCPYCSYIIRRSMEYEFFNRPIKKK